VNMDIYKRSHEIGRAARLAFPAYDPARADWEQIGLAAVSRAYEIDGVNELLAAAEVAVHSEEFDLVAERLRTAIAKCREARNA